MKKLTVLLLALSLCLTLFGCAMFEKEVIVECDHEEFEDLLEMIEDGEFEAAHAYLYEMEGVAIPMEPEMPEQIVVEPMPEAPAEPEVPAEPDTTGLLVATEITTVDNLGNVNDSSGQYWVYDTQGRVIETDSEELQEYFGYEFATFVPHFELEYDENNVVSKINVMEHEDITGILTFEYDEQGNLLHTHIVTNTGDFDVYFTYDEAGNRLTGERFDAWYETIEYFTYSYDDAGRLVQRVHDDETPWNYIITTDYTYDAEGRIAGTTETWNQNLFENETWHNFNTYAYADNGKLLSITTTTDEPESTYAEEITYYIYG